MWVDGGAPSPLPELPNSWAEFSRLLEEGQLPDDWAINEGLCSGDPAVLDRFLAVARQAPRQDARHRLSHYLSGCSDERRCPRLLELFLAHEDLRFLLGEPLADCQEQTIGPALDAGHLPDAVAVQWWMTRHRNSHWPIEMSAALAGAVERLARTDWPALDRYLPAQPSFNELQGSHVLPTLLTLHALAPSADERKRVAAALVGQTDPRAQAIYKKECKVPDKLRLCDYGSLKFDKSGLPYLVSSSFFDRVIRLRAAEPEMPAALEECVRGAETQQIRVKCFAALAEADFSRARKLAEELRPVFQTPLLKEATAFVLSAPDFEGAHARLVRLGLMGPPRTRTPLARKAMAQTARGLEVSLTKTYEEMVLSQLVRLVGSPLSDVRFGVKEERAEGGYSTTRWTVDIRAWMDGSAHAVRYEHSGVHSPFVLAGLLNALSAKRGSDVRWLPLAPEGKQTAIVIGKSASLVTAVADGLLLPATVQNVEAVAFDDMLGGSRK